LTTIPALLIAAVIFAAPIALLAAWSPIAGTVVIALALTGAALIRPG
jgi:hypothetical protein